MSALFSKKRKRDSDPSRHVADTAVPGSSGGKRGSWAGPSASEPSDLPAHQNKRRKLLSKMLDQSTSAKPAQSSSSPQTKLGKFHNSGPTKLSAPRTSPSKFQDKPHPQKQNSAAKVEPRPPAPALSTKSSISASTASKLIAARTKLDGARFRFLNEQLYTTNGNASFTRFQAQPSLFDVYHEGYRAQVEKWPEYPADIFIAQIARLPESLVIGDFGCGEAKIGKSVKNKVYSFDLIARDKSVIACDIAHVPLEDEALDMAIFSLSLMGTNFMDFLAEAHRVLKVGGELKIAEVKSRFENIPAFLQALKSLGFDLKRKDESNKMFVLFDFVKSDRQSKKTALALKACKYKKR